MSTYKDRIKSLCAWLDEEKVDAVYLTSDPDVRYYTGMPGDSVLVIFAGSKSVLLPWDINLANSLAVADEIIPYTEYNRDLGTALKAVLSDSSNGPVSRIEIPGTTTYPAVTKLAEQLQGIDVVCRSDGLIDAVSSRRCRKDATEIATLMKAASITNDILDLLEGEFNTGSLKTEIDIAMFLEREARARGAEGTGFETIAAGPSRSNGIHAFPSYTNALFAARGTGIIDFGVRFDGYTSDVTVTAVFGKPVGAQGEMLALVQQAYDEAVEKAVIGADAGDIARHVDSIFAAAGYEMPHSLGHGIGLEVHEAPRITSKSTDPSPLEPGMVFTIEPGLYHPTDGGVRLENDVLLTESESRVITKSRILYLPDPD